jgi:putative PIN family toxin of toxin-antitoxin system
MGEVLSEDHPGIHLHPIISYLIQNAEIITAPALSQPVCEDPDDNKFIAAALASNCLIIISGDKHLLKFSGFQGVEILKPREFLDKYFF